MENENISDVVVVEEPVPEGTPSGSDSETETIIDSSDVESAADNISASDSTLGESATEGEQTIDEKLNTIIETLNPEEEVTVPEDTTDYSKLLYEFMVENYTPQDEVVYTIFDKPLNDYSVSEGILFLILVVLLAKCFINVIKDTLWRW